MNAPSRYKSNTVKKKEKSLIEIIHILYKRKFIIISSVFTLLVLALIYSYTATPIYEAKVVLKKEVAPGKGETNEFYDIVKMQTQDEVETEMELVKTGEVLGKVINELNLFLTYDKVVDRYGTTTELNRMIVDYTNPKYKNNIQNVKLPEFISVELKDEKKQGNYFIEKVSETEYSLHDVESEKLLLKVTSNLENLHAKDSISNMIQDDNADIAKDTLVFDVDLALMELTWQDAPVGNRFYFSIKSFYSTVLHFGKTISINRKGKTNVFNVSVKATSAYTAMVLANLLIDKFRESRIEQQKQTIRYSFNFVDEQLEKMQFKLREAEDNLSSFKSSGQITTIDASSREVIKFISTLEAEKMNTNLKLAEYKNKLKDMKNEMTSSGYFDQSFLSPDGGTTGNDPFSALMSQLSNLELKKLELLQKRTENHPDVINLEEQIRLAKEKLASYNENTLTAYQIIINSLEKKQLDIVNMMSKYEVKLEMLPGQENKLARLIREKDVYEKMFTLLLDKREEMRLAELSKLQDIIVVDPAKEPLKPVSPKKSFNMMIAFVLGSFIGIIGVFLIEIKNSKLVNLDEIEEEFQIPVFALIPAFSKKLKSRVENASDNTDKFVTLMDDEDGYKESFRLLKTKLRIHMEGRRKIFMITSCEENTGKTTVAANLAISIAQENQRVLLIDADLRKAQLSKMFDIPNEKPGLIQYLSSNVHPEICTVMFKRLDVLPAGGIREDSSHLLNSERMKLLFTSIDTSIYDYVIIDTPPVTRIVDTLVLGSTVKDALLVIRPNLSYNESVWGGILEMIQAKIKIRGLITNGAEIKESYYYRYRYGYGYGYSSSDDTKVSNRRRKSQQKVTAS
jgi:capsular exopolysaccharide synthesis family protein